MFKLMKDFMVSMFSMSIGWQIWLLILMLVNAVIPLAFFQHMEARLAVACVVGGMTIGLAIFKVQGFTRLLGLMHLPWLPFMLFIWSRMSLAPADTPFGIWVRALLLLNGISLIIDTVDVVRYFTGEEVRISP